jgi:hypothetical protein
MEDRYKPFKINDKVAVFKLLDPHNRDYMFGNAKHIFSPRGWDLVYSGVMLGTIFGVIFAVSMLGLLDNLLNNNTPVGSIMLGGIMGGGAVVVFYEVFAALRDLRANRRLEREGRILRGDVTRVEQYTQGLFGRGLALRVGYRFTAPDGRTETGTTQIGVQRGTPILSPGDPLVVVYVDEKLHKVL